VNTLILAVGQAPPVGSGAAAGQFAGGAGIAIIVVIIYLCIGKKRS
jgi:hypothetical protein